MPRPVLLNNVDHHDLGVALERGTAWGDGVNQIAVFPTEFEALSREYVLVFRRSATGAFRAVALLGFERDENLFVDGDRWVARTIPALLQRGPFSIALPAPGEAGEPMVHVDLDDPRLRRGAGEPVFLPHGGNAPYLDHLSAVLRAIYGGTQVAPAMFAAFVEAGLIEQTTLELETPDGRSVTVPDAWIVSAERFAALDAATLAHLHQDDFLRCAVWMLSSLGNFPALLDRKLARDG